MPAEPIFNINANRWSAHAPGTSYFLPVNDLTFMYVNGLLEILNETTGAFILDERNSFRPAGLGRFARSQGGHLEDNPHQGRVATLRQVEQFVTDFVTIEQGMMLQNQGPLIARMDHSVIQVDQARLTGPSTSIQVGGKLALGHSVDVAAGTQSAGQTQQFADCLERKAQVDGSPDET